MGNASGICMRLVTKLWALPTPKYGKGGACYQAQFPDFPWLVRWLAIFVLFSFQECPMRQLVGAFVAAVASRLMYHNIAGDAAALQHCRNGHFRRNEKGQGFGQGTLPMPWLTLPAFFRMVLFFGREILCLHKMRAGVLSRAHCLCPG
jgi:hypothetical protein